MRTIAKTQLPVADPEMDRLRAIFRLGEELGKLVKKRRKDRKAIQTNLDAARALGVRIDVKASEL